MKVLSSIKITSTIILGLFVPGMVAVNAQSATNTAAVASLANTSTNPTYIHDILPLFLGKCARCHNESGAYLPDWSDYKVAYRDRMEIKRRVWDSFKGKYYKQPMPAGNCPEMRTITEDDRLLIKDWVDNGAPYGTLSSSATDAPKTEEGRLQLGKRLFTITCVPCHQANGLGVPNRFPPLAASDFLNADKKRAIKILINGRQGPITVNGISLTNSMPRFPLSDEEIADVLTYVYGSYGNSGQHVAADEVKAARMEKEDSTTPFVPAKAAPNKYE